MQYCDQHMKFSNFSTKLWLLTSVNISIFLNTFKNNEWILIKFCLYIWSMLWLIHIIFPNFSTELWPLIDFRIMFMLSVLWNNWWIWSKLVDTLIFYAKTYATTKISTVAGYHVVLATLLLIDKNSILYIPPIQVHQNYAYYLPTSNTCQTNYKNCLGNVVRGGGEGGGHYSPTPPPRIHEAKTVYVFKELVTQYPIPYPQNIK